MSDIFVSYASEDRERIQPIIKVLEKNGWSVWWDRKIPIGRTFDDVIEEAIDDAKCIVVIWTKTSVKSKWVRTEASEGDRLGILIPIQIDDIKIPLNYRIPYMEPEGQDPSLKGEIKVEFLYILFKYDTLLYDFYITDRAENESNVESTPVMILPEVNN